MWGREKTGTRETFKIMLAVMSFKGRTFGVFVLVFKQRCIRDAPVLSWLLDGVARFGLGEWAQVLKAIWGKRVDFPKRSSTDLKDKWRNLVASTTKPEGFKFRAQYVTPALLAKTKEVMEAAEKMKELDEAREAAEMRAKRAAVVAAQRSAPGV